MIMIRLFALAGEVIRLGRLVPESIMCRWRKVGLSLITGERGRLREAVLAELGAPDRTDVPVHGPQDGR